MNLNGDLYCRYRKSPYSNVSADQKIKIYLKFIACNALNNSVMPTSITENRITALTNTRLSFSARPDTISRLRNEARKQANKTAIAIAKHI